jgi:hypothetical protein
MRGGNWVGVVGRRLRKQASYGSHSTSSPPEYPNILGPNLPDVWTSTTQSHRPQSSVKLKNMRGGNWVGVVGRRLRKQASYGSHSTSSPPEYPNILGPNLPDVWTSTTQSHRPQSSGSFC